MADKETHTLRLWRDDLEKPKCPDCNGAGRLVLGKVISICHECLGTGFANLRDAMVKCSS
jgi:hypothetical protein